MYVLLILFLPQCGEMSNNEGVDEGDISNNLSKEPKYYTSGNEGRWESQADSHTPIITFNNNDKNTIEVCIPFLPRKNPRHFIEVIALMQGEKQIASKKIPFSLSRAKATFTLPDPDRADYWIVAKCNLHDMWKAPVKRK